MRISDWSSDVCSSDLLPGSILYKPGETQDFFSVIASKSPAIPQSMKCLLFPEMGRLFIQHYRLGLKIGQQPLDTALAPDAGLFKSPEGDGRSEEHTSELQSLMRISYAVFCLKKKHNIS